MKKSLILLTGILVGSSCVVFAKTIMLKTQDKEILKDMKKCKKVHRGDNISEDKCGVYMRIFDANGRLLQKPLSALFNKKYLISDDAATIYLLYLEQHARGVSRQFAGKIHTPLKKVYQIGLGDIVGDSRIQRGLLVIK